MCVNIRMTRCGSILRCAWPSVIPGHQKYVSISGQAQISNDREMIKKLWSVPAKAWWQSADDPNIRVIRVSPEEAEWWDSPGTVVSYISMAAAAVTGSRPAVGEHRRASI